MANFDRKLSFLYLSQPKWLEKGWFLIKIGDFGVELTIFDEKCDIFIGGDVQECTEV